METKNRLAGVETGHWSCYYMVFHNCILCQKVVKPHRELEDASNQGEDVPPPDPEHYHTSNPTSNLRKIWNKISTW